MAVSSWGNLTCRISCFDPGSAAILGLATDGPVKFVQTYHKYTDSDAVRTLPPKTETYINWYSFKLQIQPEVLNLHLAEHQIDYDCILPQS